MNIIIPLFLIISAGFFHISPADAIQYAPGEVIVKYKKHMGKAKLQSHMAKLGAKRLRTLPLAGMEHLRLPFGVSVEDAVVALREDPDVEYAEPNYKVKAAQTSVANDVYFPSQWGLENTGQLINGNSGPYAGTPDADIDAPEAWAIHNGTGGQAVIVAVIDTGIDYAHEDLTANIWINPGEGPAADGLDNDENGHVDDIYGWNFTSGDYPGSLPANDPMDDDYESHGTHIAGIIGAPGGNGKGVAGVNWGAKLMAVKALDNFGEGYLSGILMSMDYAVKNGAKFINASYTYPLDCSKLEFGPSQAEKEAIKKAGDSGVIFIAAAGNSGCDNDVYPFYPASHPLPNVISVAASDAYDGLTVFSNRGKHSVHLSAPGFDVLSAVSNNGYDYLDGTSMAAPFVTGLLSLLSSYRPDLDAGSLREAVFLSTDFKPLLSGTMSGGRINAYNALTFDFASASPFRPSHLSAYRGGKKITVSWIDNSKMETAFELERKTASSYALVSTLPAGTPTYTEPSAPEGQNCYRARALNSNGYSPYSNETCIYLIYPPSNLTAAETSPGEISLSWADNSSIEEGYKVEMSASGGVYNVIANLSPGTTTYKNSGVAASTGYTYRVKAFSSSGESDYSNTASAASTAQPVPESGGGDGGMCFIATAAYGSGLAPEVQTLREFRDAFLLTNRAGRFVVGLYYGYSPPMAEYISRREKTRFAVRAMLTPIVYVISRRAVSFSAFAAVFLLAGVIIIRRRRKHAAKDK